MTSRVGEVLTLSDRSSADPAVAGGKAARLAHARAAGLPVLPGIVVPASAGASALRDGMGRLGFEGVHGARLAVMSADVSGLADLPRAVAELGDSLVVRSSSPVEATGTWSGAFTSYVDVRPDDVLTAVRGVWASALDEDALGRLEGEGQGRQPPPMAVLIQPEVRPEFSGTAEVAEDGNVLVVAVAGSPAALLAGWEPGATARVGPEGTVGDGAAVDLAGAAVLRRVAELARTVRAELGDTLVEWATVDGQIVLLQSKTGARPSAGAAPASSHTPPDPPGDLPHAAKTVAHHVVRYAGATGERLVLPWLLAGTAAPPAPATGGAVSDRAAVQAWEEATRLAGRLTADARPDADDPGRDAEEMLGALRGPDAADALRLLASLPAPDACAAARVLDLLARVADHLVASGAIARERDLWALQPHDVFRLLAEGGVRDVAGAARRAALRWEPFVHTAVMTHGERVTGQPVSPGSGAGPVVFVPGRPERTDLPPRAVIVAPRPLPHLAPLLWGASALVTFGGSAAAHLVEVARSLTVPAVVGCPGEGLLADRSGEALAAVDGDRGVVAVGAPEDTRTPRPARWTGR